MEIDDNKKKKNKISNPMRNIMIEKVTINLGIGGAGERMENIKKYCEKLFGRTFVKTYAKKRNPTFKLKKGESIGLKCTFRGNKAIEILKNALTSIRNKIKKTSFDKKGNFSFGIKEYIEYPGAKYDSEIGLFGFDVCVTLKRRGFRVMDRKIGRSKIAKNHWPTCDEAIAFLKNEFKTEII